jgi:hypothetical protein
MHSWDQLVSCVMGASFIGFGRISRLFLKCNFIKYIPRYGVIFLTFDPVSWIFSKSSEKLIQKVAAHAVGHLFESRSDVNQRYWKFSSFLPLKYTKQVGVAVTLNYPFYVSVVLLAMLIDLFVVFFTLYKRAPLFSSEMKPSMMRFHYPSLFSELIYLYCYFRSWKSVTKERITKN